MRTIKLFEEYRETTHKAINTIRKGMDSSLMKGIIRIGSFIDDIIHLNFKAASHSIKNKSGYEKLSKLANELGTLKIIMNQSDEDVDFDDFRQYGLNPDVLLYIEDEDVKEYFLNDPRSFNVVYTYKYLEIFHEYAEWCRENPVEISESKLNEGFVDKNNYYSCNSCNALFKSKQVLDTCKHCGVDEITTEEKVHWYNEVNNRSEGGEKLTN
tara:strand:+ start:58894 stop:59529 length:636 start_codon:yes stop_codon:yes gene_type:complete